jgi:hypothetical protein
MNTTKKIKGKMIAAIITFAATIFTGCVPTPGGGGTTPSGTFNVGLFLTNSQEYMAYWDNNSFINSKKITIDGDTIEFGLFGSSWGALSISVMTYSYDIKVPNNNYEIYVEKDSLGNITKRTFPALKTINNNSSSTNWNNLYATINSEVLTQEIGFVGMGIALNDVNLLYNEGYCIIRKKIDSNNYKYFWIKLRQQSRYDVIPNMYSQGPKFFRLDILNGKYQMNSITTGL